MLPDGRKPTISPRNGCAQPACTADSCNRRHGRRVHVYIHRRNYRADLLRDFSALCRTVQHAGWEKQRLEGTTNRGAFRRTSFAGSITSPTYTTPVTHTSDFQHVSAIGSRCVFDTRIRTQVAALLLGFWYAPLIL